MRVEVRPVPPSAATPANAVWEIRTLYGSPEAEVGFARLTLRTLTARLLGAEAGPYVVAEWVRVRPEYRAQWYRRYAPDLLEAVLGLTEEIAGTHDVKGLLFDPLAPSIQRLARRLHLEQIGESPTLFYRLGLDELLAAKRLLGD